MIHKFFTAICLMTMLALAGCGDAKKTDAKTGKTGDDAKTGEMKTGEEAKTEKEMKTEMKTDAEKTAPMPDGDDPIPMPFPEIDPLENTDDPPPTNQETGSAAKNDGLQLKKE